ncbi:hypothetical protein EG68_04410 [Paragonimus skrjabini miyazakii]|uniref:Uncharacterized protein n=1 Tax=Paragonimus skrjabini miyazakii TaxID=59628 RepID=A0A8S9YZ91_9TREM|nr:hypothetical protein EG68_04410 [Paragonimus skrjabini miyazakii]
MRLLRLLQHVVAQCDWPPSCSQPVNEDGSPHLNYKITQNKISSILPDGCHSHAINQGKGNNPFLRLRE